MKPCKQWDKLPYQVVIARFLNHQQWIIFDQLFPRLMDRLRNICVKNCATNAVSVKGTAQLLGVES